MKLMPDSLAMRPLVAIQETLMQRSFQTSAVVTRDHSDTLPLKWWRARSTSASTTFVKKTRTLLFTKMISK